MELLLRCDLVLATAGPFTKVARVDLAVEVAPDTGGLCPYPCSLNSLEVSSARPLTWEYWQLAILH